MRRITNATASKVVVHTGVAPLVVKPVKTQRGLKLTKLLIEFYPRRHAL